MKKLLMLIPLLTLALPVHAGLGAASSGSGSNSSYDAFCGRSGSKCKVAFKDGKLVVNNKDSITYDQIIYIGRHHVLYTPEQTYSIDYVENGVTESAKIIFIHYETGTKFWADLQRACKHCRERPTVLEHHLK